MILYWFLYSKYNGFIGKFLVCWQEQVGMIKTSKHLRGFQGFYWRLVAPPPPWTACPGCSSWQGRSATWLRSRFSITFPPENTTPTTLAKKIFVSLQIWLAGNPDLREICHSYVLGYCVLAEELHGTEPATKSAQVIHRHLVFIIQVS